MAAETAGTKAASEKVRPHGVQNDWLNQGKGKLVDVTLNSVQVLNGRLVGYDIYCIAVDESGQEGVTLIYKHSIVFARFSR
jgi:sRNA-binding regulator protein Hfq